MYVFWTRSVSNGVHRTKGTPITRISHSSIHLSDGYSSYRTACNMRIPVGVEQQRVENVNDLPKDRVQCKNCFK